MSSASSINKIFFIEAILSSFYQAHYIIGIEKMKVKHQQRKNRRRGTASGILFARVIVLEEESHKTLSTV